MTIKQQLAWLLFKKAPPVYCPACGKAVIVETQLAQRLTGGFLCPNWNTNNQRHHGSYRTYFVAAVREGNFLVCLAYRINIYREKILGYWHGTM